MNADAFRYLYEYHFSENRKIWDGFIAHLTYEQFIEPAEYSHGSIRDQFVHAVNADLIWFGELSGEIPELREPDTFNDKDGIRSYMDGIEHYMRNYLSNLNDKMLFSKPIKFDEDKELIVWQVLIHVINHATDHRAQILRSLHDLGIETPPQDFIFYVYDHLL